mgnify:CR=1 FL=1
MAADEIYELVVAIETEGAQDVQEDLEATEQAFDETADTAEEEATVLERFSRKWQGAMQIITGALTLATGALLSQVPVVQDLMDGLGAVVESTALRLDEFRGPIDNIVNDLFNLAQAIGEDDNEGILLSLLNLIDHIGAASDEFNRAINPIFRFQAAIRDAISAGLGFAIDFVSDHASDFIDGIRRWTGRSLDRFVEWSGNVIDTISEWADDVIDFTLSGLASWNVTIDEWLESAALKFSNWRVDVIDHIEGWGASVIDRTVSWGEGWDTTIREWTDRAMEYLENRTQDARDKIRGYLDDIRDKLRSARRAVDDWIDRQVGRITGGGGGINDVSTNRRIGSEGFTKDTASRLGYDIGQTGGIMEEAGLVWAERGETLTPPGAGRLNEGSPRNIFADRQELHVVFHPSRFRDFLSAELNDGPANVGRGGGPRG